MGDTSRSGWEEEVARFTKMAQEKDLDPLTWAIQVSSTLSSVGVSFPSPELASVMVSHICWENDTPTAWKYLEKAVAANLTPSILVLALLSTRVIPSRRRRPVAFRLYLEILKRHPSTFSSQISGPSYKRTLVLVDDILHLSQNLDVQACEPGVFVVAFVFCIIWQLLDTVLDDEGLLDLTLDKKSRWISIFQENEMVEIFDEKRNEAFAKLLTANTEMAIEVVGQLLCHKIIIKLLSLARQNMKSAWESFTQRLQLLAANSAALQNTKISPGNLIDLPLDNISEFRQQYKPSQYKEFCAFSSGPLASPGGHIHGSSHSALWIPLDLYLEDAIDGPIAATTAIEDLSGLVKALQAVNQTTWHDAFLGLWMAALRLVQRERDPIEGPVPQIDTRMCMLLSISTLAIMDIIEEEENAAYNESESNTAVPWTDKTIPGQRRKALVSSLQLLGDYKGLLSPPLSIVSVANQAAVKAMMFVSGLPVSSNYFENVSVIDKEANYSGNMRHLIVEACIARDILDTSAYFWPGYVKGCINTLPHSVPSQIPCWSMLMKGSPLNSSMINALVNTPASSLVELEKIFEITLNGSDGDKISAATILCGASLIRGWNIQEHTVRLVMKLLQPPDSVDFSGNKDHMINNAPLLNVVLTGISSVDCVQVFSFHGLIPELAAALMPICEVFGSCKPDMTWTLPTGEENSAHIVFSNAFTLLLRLWKFNHPPIEYYMMGDGAPVGSQLTPEYLLLLRNSQADSISGATKNRKNSRYLLHSENSRRPIFLDSFPNLKNWYRQHQICLASALSGLVHGSPVHQNVSSLLNMMFERIRKGDNQATGPAISSNSNISSSSAPMNEDASTRPKLPAWDIMEAVPFVVDAALTACSHGRLSPRELATGLKDLADFLPASLASIASYFSAEVTRGVWKPAFMNGSDWPSPAANLSTVEDHIKKIIAATGADAPSLTTGSSPTTLPLPLAAFVSLTITYRLDKASERFLYLAGPALDNLAASCPWPSMPIVAALWAQKVKRWSDFLTFSASSTVFHHNNNAVVQLLKSCFSATVGLSEISTSGNGGVGKLLGHGFSSQVSGSFSSVAPGILYLRIHRSISDIMVLTDQILSLLLLSVREIACNRLPQEIREKLKNSRSVVRYGQVSLVSALTQVKIAASVGATFVWLAGGSGLVRYLFRELLPSWFLSVHESEQGGSGGMVAMLEGFALAYFALLCGMFAWGISPNSKRRPKVLASHFQFLADALDGKIVLGCSLATWRAYVLGFLGLVVDSAPSWVMGIELGLLKRLSNGLRKWNESELALLLLRAGGMAAMGAAAEHILTGE